MNAVQAPADPLLEAFKQAVAEKNYRGGAAILIFHASLLLEQETGKTFSREAQDSLIDKYAKELEDKHAS